MKSKRLICAGVALLLAAMLPASAISASRIEGIKKRAAEDNKAVVFVTTLACKNGNCPIARDRVDGRNTSVQRAIPRKNTIIVKLDEGDVKDDALPAIVRSSLPFPGIVVTNASCTEVIDKVGHGVDKERAKEMEKKIEVALASQAASKSATASKPE